MKKTLLSLGALMLVSSGYAQMTIGAKGGLNYTSWSTKYEEEPDEKPDNPSGIGFHLGGYANFGLSDNIGIQPELLYSMRSGKADGSHTEVVDMFGSTYTYESDYTDKSSYGYIELPILLNLAVSEKLHVHVGPGFGFLMGGKVSSEGTTTTTVTTGGSSTTTSEDFSDEVSGSDATEGMNKTEIGGIIGLAYQGEGPLGFSLRYWRGLNPVNEETDFATVKTNLIQLSVSYAFVQP